MKQTANEIESVLVHVGLDRLGDGLLKLPFVRGLKSAFPNARVTWFAGKETTVYAGVLAPLVDGYLDEIIEYGGIGDSPKEVFAKRPLSGRRFDLVIDTQRNFWIAMAVRRIRHEDFMSPAARFLLSSQKPPHGYKSPKAMQRQLLDLLEIASGQSLATPATLELELPAAHISTAADLLPRGPSYVGFAPGSGGRPKCWPLERFIAVAQHVCDKGHKPVFLIGPQEEEWADVIRRDVPDAILPLQMNQDGAGQGAAGHNYNPLQTIALGARMAAAVSNDSGIAHMLAVAGAPLMALYGPTVYEKFPPMTEDITVIRAETYGSREMSAIPVDAVMGALLTRLAQEPAS